MAYRVTIDPVASRALRKLSRQIRERILLAVSLLADTPRPPSARKLSGSEDFYRIRVRDYRIIYEIEDVCVCAYVLFASQ
ncbi:MAG: type II toxin-antitoxin system RelE family toxin [Candidatus Hydrogenedentota bacterium]